MKSLSNLSKEQRREVIIDWASKELSDKISELNILNNEILNIISYTGIDIMFEPVTS